MSIIISLILDFEGLEGQWRQSHPSPSVSLEVFITITVRLLRYVKYQNV